MKVLSAIGRFFARIGRWIKETAWIQPLLIVGAIFAIIFAIPHIIDAFKSLSSESDAQNKYFGKHQISLTNADVYSDGKSVGNSKVDELFSWLEEGDDDSINSLTKKYGNQFFLAFIEEDNANCKDLYSGIKMFEELWNKKNAEFADLTGTFKLHTIYLDSISKVDDETNLFDEVWGNHYDLFETLSNDRFLPQTYYAKNNNYEQDDYAKAFIAEESKKCPIGAPLVMYFDFTKDAQGNYKNWTDGGNQLVKGLSDVMFSVKGNTDLEKARTLRRCWNHLEEFSSITND